MNKVVITKCIECANWCPADSYGGGVYCDELQEKITDDCDAPIPDKCPKISQDNIESANTAEAAKNNNERVQSLCDNCCNGMCEVPDFNSSAWKKYGIVISKCEKYRGTKPVS